jgi:general L-amino acid transport system substrate-binding protein
MDGDGSRDAGIALASVRGSSAVSAAPRKEKTMTITLRHIAAALATAAALAAGPVQAQGRSATLEVVKQRGNLVCGGNTGLPGFSIPDAQGNWTGFDVDFCRAIAAAVFNDPTKVRFVGTTSVNRFTVLQSGEVDVLSRNVTWTSSRDTSLGFNFGPVTYYDGQGFMVRRSIGAKSVKDLSGATICVNQGSTTELNLADYFRANAMQLKVVSFPTGEESVKAYEAGRCDSFTTDVSGLYAERLKLAGQADHVILPEIISKEPLAPAVRHGDDQWLDVVRWVQYAMLTAEELGVTKANVDEMMRSTNPDVRRLLGVEGKHGEALGLTNDWAYRIVKHVGNYGESFERNVGKGSRLGIDRGLNRLWSDGGLQYAPPIR